jgi:hypothetical protein
VASEPHFARLNYRRMSSLRTGHTNATVRKLLTFTEMMNFMETLIEI